MSAPENPQAFPHLQAYDPSISYVASGMTLRDWFAGQALAGLMFRADGPECRSEVASMAYTIADALLATRQGDK